MSNARTRKARSFRLDSATRDAVRALAVPTLRRLGRMPAEQEMQKVVSEWGHAMHEQDGRGCPSCRQVVVAARIAMNEAADIIRSVRRRMPRIADGGEVAR
jgi:hypothetical protein